MGFLKKEKESEGTEMHKMQSRSAKEIEARKEGNQVKDEWMEVQDGKIIKHRIKANGNHYRTFVGNAKGEKNEAFLKALKSQGKLR